VVHANFRPRFVPRRFTVRRHPKRQCRAVLMAAAARSRRCVSGHRAGYSCAPIPRRNPSAFLGEIFYLASLVCLLCPLPRRSPLLSRRGPSGDQRRADLARTASPVCLRVMGTRAARQALMKTTQGEGRFLRAKKTQLWRTESHAQKLHEPMNESAGDSGGRRGGWRGLRRGDAGGP
jgi:hypothetical protein